MEGSFTLTLRYQREEPCSLWKGLWMTFLSSCESSGSVYLKLSLSRLSTDPFTTPSLRNDSTKVPLLWISAPGEGLSGQRLFPTTSKLTTYSPKEHVEDYEAKSAMKWRLDRGRMNARGHSRVSLGVCFLLWVLSSHKEDLLNLIFFLMIKTSKPV